MKKEFSICLIVISSFFLTSCEKNTEKIDENFELPQGMKDCNIYKMKGSDLKVIYAVRCPLSTTTVVTSGKNSTKIIVSETNEDFSIKENDKSK